eukprot:m51a1_g9744 hypothetical protein (200) ;mRNA; f:1571263-1572106
MGKALVVVAHQQLQGSFNGAILGIVTDILRSASLPYTVRDLYAMKFDPVLSERDLEGTRTGDAAEDVKAEQALVAEAELLVFVHPVWWVSFPAILRGYIDRVLSAEFAYRPRPDGTIEGLLRGKRVVIVSTAGEHREPFERKYEGAMREAIDEGTFGFCGVTDVRHHYLCGVLDCSDAQRRQMLQDLELKLRHDLQLAQ